MKRILAILISALLLTSIFAQDIEQVQAEGGHSKVSSLKARQAMDQLFQNRVARQVPGSEPSAIDIYLDEEDWRTMEKRREGIPALGLTKDLGVQVELGSIFTLRPKRPMETGFGIVRQSGDDLVWTAMLYLEGASGIRLRFTDFHLPEGAKLYVYSDMGQAFGPYTNMGPNGRGKFWSDTLFAEVAYVQVETEGSIDPERLSFTIEKAAYFGENFLLGKSFLDHRRGKNCYGTGGLTSCFKNARCYDSDTTVQKLMNADAWFLYQSDSDGDWYGCSGSLINGTGATSSYPYFLTAAHCVNSSTEVDSMEAYFDFSTSGCNSLTSNCNSAFSSANKVSGGTLQATNNASNADYSLIKLSDFPNGSYWKLGWHSADYSDNDGETLYRVSHPNHYPQSYAEHEVDTSISICYSNTRPTYIYTRHTLGYTEGGSSGSALVNSSAQIVGHDRGRCSDQTCNDTLAVRDGHFRYAYFDKLRPFLYPTDIHVENITVTEESMGGGHYRAKVEVQVLDTKDVPVSSAMIMLNINGFGMIGMTGSDGWATIYGMPWPASQTWTACTQSIFHPWLTWDSSEDVESCDSN